MIEALKESVRDAQTKARDTELEWRSAADALFLIAGDDVVLAAERHLKATEARIAEAKNGTLATGEGAYRQLNDAMRDELIALVDRPLALARAETRKPAFRFFWIKL